MKGDRPAWRAAFMLWGGPAAWLVQLCVGETLTGWPCFPGRERLAVPLAGYGWTGIAALLLLLAGAALGFFAAWLAWRSRSAARATAEADEREEFFGLWSLVLGLGFGIATLATLIAFAMVPQCLG